MCAVRSLFRLSFPCCSHSFIQHIKVRVFQRFCCWHFDCCRREQHTHTHKQISVQEKLTNLCLCLVTSSLFGVGVYGTRCAPHARRKWNYSSSFKTCSVLLFCSFLHSSSYYYYHNYLLLLHAMLMWCYWMLPNLLTRAMSCTVLCILFFSFFLCYRLQLRSVLCVLWMNFVNIYINYYTEVDSMKPQWNKTRKWRKWNEMSEQMKSNRIDDPPNGIH